MKYRLRKTLNNPWDNPQESEIGEEDVSPNLIEEVLLNRYILNLSSTFQDNTVLHAKHRDYMIYSIKARTEVC